MLANKTTPAGQATARMAQKNESLRLWLIADAATMHSNVPKMLGIRKRRVRNTLFSWDRQALLLVQIKWGLVKVNMMEGSW